jgi:Skp family chaperone for outer membrane proteins
VKTWIVGIIAGLCVAAPLYGQEEAKLAGTRIAFVNIAQVFHQFSKVNSGRTTFTDWEKLGPYKEKAKKLMEEAKGWEDLLRTGFVALQDVEKYQNAIKKNKRDIEDMSTEISRVLAKHQEENLVTLWKEIEVGVSTVAEAGKYNLVVGYGDPVEENMLYKFPNINRKMQAMDMGSSVPLYVNANTDLTDLVVQALNTGKLPELQKPAAFTKIAVVNVKTVMDQYWRSQERTTEVEQTIRPYKEKAKVLTDQLEDWKGRLRGGSAMPDVGNYQNAVKANQRKLEDLATEAHLVVTEQQESHLVLSYREINEAISSLAKANGYDIVLGFKPPNPYHSVDPKKQSIEMGGLVAFHMDGSCDITAIVIESLNSRRSAAPKKSPAK